MRCTTVFTSTLKKISTSTLFWGIGVVAITLFIFGNSFLDFEASHTVSDAVTELITAQTTDPAQKGITLEYLVRKTAHVIEFACLGVIALRFGQVMTARGFRVERGAVWFYVLLVGVMDEFIQKFSGRYSSVGDVLLDFGGSLLGFGALWCIRMLYQKWKKSKRKGVDLCE